MGCKLFKIGKIWHYRFQIAHVKFHKTTRETTLKRAEIVAQKAYDDAINCANGIPNMPTLDELIQDWLAIRGPVMSTAHVRGVQVFARQHLYGLGSRTINAITTSHVELARNEHMLTRNPASGNAWLRILKLLVNWAVKRDIIAKLPWSVGMLPVQKHPRAILPLNLVTAWFAAIDKATQRRPTIGIAVRFMFGLGLRESETISARWEWIDWERKTYTPGITKGKEADPIPVMDWILDYLAPQRKQNGLIVHKPNGKALRPGFSRMAMQAANTSCSISGITPHRLRGTFATQLSVEGVPIQIIQKVMRHKDPMTTMTYLEVDLAIAVEAQKRIAEKMGLWPSGIHPSLSAAEN